MFAQVIQGRVSDGAGARKALDQWQRDLAPGASGWVGTTAGTTEDGQFVAIARFESEEAARRNSDREEQGRWWAETSQLIDGKAAFSNSTDVHVDVSGDPGNAGFVQVIRGRGSDPARAREIMAQDADKWADFRPDIIGSVEIQHDGGAYTMVLYFTSEQEAREGERKEPPAELKAQMDEMTVLSIGEPEFVDLKQPWFYSPD